MEEILKYIDIVYVFCLLAGMEAWKKYLCNVKISKRLVTLILAVLLALAFLQLNDGWNDSKYIMKIMVSFLGSIGLYDFVVAPLKKKLMPKK